MQNKMLYAVTTHTAAELIELRADEGAANMGLTSWRGVQVRKGDVATAKNYLAEAERIAYERFDAVRKTAFSSADELGELAKIAGVASATQASARRKLRKNKREA
jgi:hypothetical protein